MLKSRTIVVNTTAGEKEVTLNELTYLQLRQVMKSKKDDADELGIELASGGVVDAEFRNTLGASAWLQLVSTYNSLNLNYDEQD